MGMSKLTTAFGAPVPDNQNTRTAGPRAPPLLQDVWFWFADVEQAAFTWRRARRGDVFNEP